MRLRLPAARRQEEAVVGSDGGRATAARSAGEGLPADGMESLWLLKLSLLGARSLCASDLAS